MRIATATTLILAFVLAALPGLSQQTWPSDAQSTTGPTPPPGILMGLPHPTRSGTVISGVPVYIWYRGCGPTAMGMVIGYYDGRGLVDLIPGNANTQTSAVNTAISSQGNWNDYCLPLDEYPNLLNDKSELPDGDEHSNNCIADFMRTSQSRRENYYGYSWYSDVGFALLEYVDWACPQYWAKIAYVGGEGAAMTWDDFRAEIDAGRPAVFLVDTDANGWTDHFVPAIGYDEVGGVKYYACLNTWDSAIHWFEFKRIASGQPWGIYGAVFCSIKPPVAHMYVDLNSPGPTHDGTSWDQAFLSIQTAVDAAGPGCQIWVADGTYVEDIVITEGIGLCGGFLGAEPGGYETALDQRNFAAHVTTIDGSTPPPTDPAIGGCVMMALNSVVDGFTITKGKATANGGAICCSDIGNGAQSTAIRNNVIVANSSGYDGGAIYCDHSSPTIENNTITGNSAEGDGGAASCENSSPTITNNTITGNSAGWNGGAIYCRGASSPSIINNTITGNKSTFGCGGAIYCGESSPIITNNTIAGNSAKGDGGAVYCSYSSATIENNMIAGNSTTNGAGGAVVCTHSSPTIENNTITGNSAKYGATVYCSVSSSPMFSNNIIVGNSGQQDAGGIWCQSLSVPVLTCNDVWGNTPNNYRGCSAGLGDISEDPLFAYPDGPDGDPATWGDNDYHLTAGSPCIDKGDNTAPETTATDIDGEERIFDWDGDGLSVVDIGADELLPKEVQAPADWFVPGWVWFSIPLMPHGSADASDVLGFACRNRVYAWDDARKTVYLYPDDFTDLAVGPSYLARFDLGEVYQSTYEGSQPQLPFERTLPAAGWCWVGVPATQDIRGVDLHVEKNGVIRAAAEDRAAPDPWLNWNWIYWDPVARTAKMMIPFGGGDDTWLHPWYGYRVWASTGDVTIIFP